MRFNAWSAAAQLKLSGENKVLGTYEALRDLQSRGVWSDLMREARRRVERAGGDPDSLRIVSITESRR